MILLRRALSVPGLSVCDDEPRPTSLSVDSANSLPADPGWTAVLEPASAGYTPARLLEVRPGSAGTVGNSTGGELVRSSRIEFVTMTQPQRELATRSSGFMNDAG